jgi:hypothetical protein
MQRPPTIYLKVYLEGGDWYYTSLAELTACIVGDACDEPDGLMAKWTIEQVKMTPEEYAALKDFSGH